MALKKSPVKSPHIEITRIYDAPVKAVWNAWVDPDQAAKWWGPRGFTITTLGKDLRPGGHWTYIMHGPDGVDYPNKALYYEVEECAKLVYDHGGYEDRPPLFRVTVHFSEAEGKTTMKMRMTLATPEAAAETRKFIKQAGGDATWDRLDEYLGETLLAENRFVINRSFGVPMETLFSMWLKPEHLAQWLPPTGLRMEFLKVDIRPGGESFYVMFNDDFKLYGKSKYLEITPPDWIAFIQEFSDEKGGLSRHPMAPIWPESMLTSVRLFAEGPEQTRVQLTTRPYSNVLPEELAAFLAERGGMTQGWTGSFDKLDAYLEGKA